MTEDRRHPNAGEHVGPVLAPHLSGELSTPEAARVEAHLADCPACREEAAALARLMEALARTAPPPPVAWSAYRAELRRKLERRGARVRAGWADLLRPAPAVLAAGLVAILAILGTLGPSPGPRPGAEPGGALEHTILASRLELIAHMQLVERLELLEDFDVIRRLHALPAQGEG